MKKSILLVKSLLIMSVLIVSCDNNDDSIQCPEAITGELIPIESDFTGRWELKSITVEDEIDITDDNEDNPSLDLFAQYSECQKDIVYNFNDDRSYELALGQVASDCSNKLKVEGTWKLSETTLTLVANCSRDLIVIDVNEDATEFVLEAVYSFKDVDGNIIKTKATSTYEKQVTES
ncbi:DUF5004 domain-containing protein [Mariniflexile ostreae]|uniref:DUF5004 domain-containing protein n=1 Tax=Mariniflexile ostreae TaxID=1520892 RepID=A0ABV5FAU1_9FLAO